MKTICFAICGAIYEHKKATRQLQELSKNYNVIPAISEFSNSNSSILQELESITKNKPIDTINSAEPIGPKDISDALIICPCTGNTLSKIANGISDNTITMLAKVHQRGNKPIVLALSSNDLLGLNLYNLAKLINSKNFFIVPFRQDNPQKKPKSLKSNFDLIEDTLKSALRGVQIQPLILSQY